MSVWLLMDLKDEKMTLKVAGAGGWGKDHRRWREGALTSGWGLELLEATLWRGL